ncbi:tRNA t(6)A37-methylthiotransferase [hydrothermal vent metagenome]|uniref:tRNA (N(6)-L-threonylcarbamoyladenosine(37)-C(2))-methylthiotransferase n=1 Tax=hydrothermal vent metagenome TaxID=652676 RepID=A0A3B1BXJ1_9ZZZZ
MNKKNKKKVSFETLGCRYNRFESAEMAYELGRAGFMAVKSSEPADVVVINTCAVTGKSAARCRAAIRHAKSSNPGARIVVTGCYSETSPKAVSAVEGVDLVVGNAEKFDIAEALSAIDPDNSRSVIVGGSELPETLPVRPVTAMEGRTNAYLNVQSGCDEVCSFCLVRVARGKSRSAEATDVTARIGDMSEAGIKEVVLTGINIGQYKCGDGITLAGLIKKIIKQTGIERIRLSSINPNDVTDELIELMAGESRVCRHLHIPLQSGSDAILKSMRRPYSASEYLKLLEMLVKRIPDIGLGADVMVGFPGEEEREFGQTRALIELSPLMMLHVFAFSPREGSAASLMPDAPEKPVAKMRSAILKKLSADKGEHFRSLFIDRTVEVLIENRRDKSGLLKGFSDNYMAVYLDGPDSLMNSIVPVRIIEAVNGHLTGEVL